MTALGRWNATAHRGVYGIGGGGGIYKSRRAGFSFFVDPFAEPQGDWALIREELFWKIQHNLVSDKLNKKQNWVSLSSQICLFCMYCMYIGYQFTLENKWSHCLPFLPNPKLRPKKTCWQQGGVYHMWWGMQVLLCISLSLNLLVLRYGKIAIELQNSQLDMYLKLYSFTTVMFPNTRQHCVLDWM